MLRVASTMGESFIWQPAIYLANKFSLSLTLIFVNVQTIDDHHDQIFVWVMIQGQRPLGILVLKENRGSNSPKISAFKILRDQRLVQFNSVVSLRCERAL